MSDNVTGTEVGRLTTWWIPIIAAIGGAAIALIGREFIEWYKRPILKIDFEELEGQKPYILDLFLESKVPVPFEREKAKVLRLIVRNAGRKPVVNCEAKMVVYKNGRREPFRSSLHWSRRDPAIYNTLDEIYKPIDLNIGDEELVDLLMLRYSTKDPKDYLREDTIVAANVITSASSREYTFKAKTAYSIKVTVYAGNTISKPFTLKLNWDGTLGGFGEAFTKA